MKDNSFEKGWEFSAKAAGSALSANIGQKYVNNVQAEITALEKSINEHKYRNLQVDNLQGYMLEEWAAGTFNADAAASGSKDRAFVKHSTGKNSVDIEIKHNDKVIKNISAKSYATPEKSAKEQARYDRELGRSRYKDMDKLVVSEHLEGAKQTAHREMLRNQESRPEIAESYAETERKLTDRIKNDKGVQSKGATRKELEEFARESKKQEFDAEDHGVSVENVISPEYMIKESMKAGLSAAALTMILQTAPEIFKAIDYLIKTGEIDVDQLKKAGIKTVSSGAEAFLRGSVACALEIMCMKGAFGAALKSVDPTMLGSLVAITMETIKDSILVAAGKMTPREMGNALVDNAVATAGFLIGMKVSESIVAMKVSASIAGTITQIIGFEIPGLGYIIGSLIGCAISAVYNIGKKKLISFCVDTGFTCFGLVEQDYTLPEEILDEMGVELAEIENAEFETAEIDCADVDYAEVEEAELETIKITILKRGIIGVNKVGYILQDS